MTPVSKGFKKAAPGRQSCQGPDAPLAHRRPGYPLPSASHDHAAHGARLGSVSPSDTKLAATRLLFQLPLDTGVMP